MAGDYSNVFGRGRYPDYYGDSNATYGGGSAFNLEQPTQPGYTPPKTSGNGLKEQQMAGSDWIQAAQLIYGMYKDRNPPKPKFEATPLSPEQKQLHQLYLQSLMNPATKDNAAKLNNIAEQQIAGLSNMKWTSPKTFSGDQGYSGSNLGFTPPWKPGGPFAPTPTKTAPTRPDGSFWNIKDHPDIAPERRLDLSRWANIEGKNIHREIDSEMGGSGGDRQVLRTVDGGGVPDFEFTHDADPTRYGYNPQHPWKGGDTSGGSVITPEQGAARIADYDERRKQLDAEIAPIVGAQPGSGGAIAQIDSKWDAFRTKHPFWANMAQGAVATLFGTFAGLPGALASKYIFHRLNRENSYQPATPNPASSPNPIP